METPKSRKGVNPLVRRVIPHRNRKRELKRTGPEFKKFPLRNTKPGKEDE